MRQQLTECWTCSEFKPLDEFGIDRTQCMDCARQKRREYRERIGPEVIKARQREYTARYRAKLRLKRNQSK